MKLLWTVLLLGLACLLCSSVLSSAQEDNVLVTDEDDDVSSNPLAMGDEDEEDGFPQPHPDIDVSYIFPDFRDRRFVSGEKVKVVFNFKNNGDESFNITHVQAALTSPYDIAYHIQNFTYEMYDLNVAPHEEASVLYTFQPDPNLEPLEFWLVAYAFYTGLNPDSSSQQDMYTLYSHTFYNSTVELVEGESDLSARRFFSYFAMLAITGLVAFAGYNFLQNYRKKTRKVEQGTKSLTTAEENDWLSGTSIAPKNRASRTPRARSAK